MPCCFASASGTPSNLAGLAMAVQEAERGGQLQRVLRE